MKKPLLIFFPIAIGLLCSSCGTPSSSDSWESDVSASIPSLNESSIGETVEIALPAVDGFSFRLLTENPAVGENVEISALSLTPSSLRISSFTVDNDPIDPLPSDQENTKIYSFLLKNASPKIEAKVVEVKEVKSLDPRLVLGELGDPYFAQGEEVVFKAGSIPGYTLTSVQVVYGDVELQKKGDLYSFTMGESEVALSGTFYKNHYPITYPASPSYEVSFASGSYFEYEDAVLFSVLPASSDVSILSVKMGEETLEPSGGFYSFAMPASPVELVIETAQKHKVIEVSESEHYGVSVTTFFQNEWVPVNETNVVSNQTLHVKPLAKGEVGNFVYDHIEVYVKDKESEDYRPSGVEVIPGEKFDRFETPLNQYLQIRVYEKEVIPVSIPYSYHGFAMGSASTSISFLSQDGGYSYRGLDNVTLTQEASGSILVDASGVLCGYDYAYQTRFFLSEDQEILLSRELSATTSFGTTESTKKTALVAMKKEGGAFDSSSSYGVMILDPSASDESKYLATLLVLNDGSETRYCYYDFTTETAHFDVEVLGSGTSSGSSYEVTFEGQTKRFSISSNPSTSRQYYANFQE
ncbi:MAG: hypothetical protein SPI58_00475 [Candidatus Enteromonas sp.]|nr:hypothetical protein [Candidatus Enteromonas sp.]